MANLIRSAVVLALLTVAASSCGSRMPYLVTPPAKHAVEETGPTLKGTFTTSDNKEEDLAADSDRPTILIFGQDTCAACSEETKNIVAVLKDPKQPPEKVRLLTVLVGAIVEDAVDWKDLHKVPWTVGIDTKSVLFKQYCPDQTVPCEIVFVPQKGIVLRHTGPAENDALMQLTGPWE